MAMIASYLIERQTMARAPTAAEASTAATQHASVGDIGSGVNCIC